MIGGRSRQLPRRIPRGLAQCSARLTDAPNLSVLARARSRRSPPSCWYLARRHAFDRAAARAIWSSSRGCPGMPTTGCTTGGPSFMYGLFEQSRIPFSRRQKSHREPPNCTRCPCGDACSALEGGRGRVFTIIWCHPLSSPSENALLMQRDIYPDDHAACVRQPAVLFC